MLRRGAAQKPVTVRVAVEYQESLFLGLLVLLKFRWFEMKKRLERLAGGTAPQRYPCNGCGGWHRLLAVQKSSSGVIINREQAILLMVCPIKVLYNMLYFGVDLIRDLMHYPRRWRNLLIH